MKSFRVLQFNMQFGQVWDEQAPNSAPIRLEETIAELLRHDADIIHLQEVEQARPPGQKIAHAPNFQRLAAALPEHHAHFAYPREDPRELPFGIGLAIFSRGPLTDCFVEHLPSPPIEFEFLGEKKTPTDRVLIGATTTLQGRELRLLNTHLLAFFMLGTSSRAHPGQRERVQALLEASAPAPTLLSGDFNVRDHIGLAAQFSKLGFQTAQTQAVTWRRMPYVLDHIVFNSPLRCLRAEVIPTPASDHHLLLADFAWA